MPTLSLVISFSFWDPLSGLNIVLYHFKQSSGQIPFLQYQIGRCCKYAGLDYFSGPPTFPSGRGWEETYSSNIQIQIQIQIQLSPQDADWRNHSFPKEKLSNEVKVKFAGRTSDYLLWWLVGGMVQILAICKMWRTYNYYYHTYISLSFLLFWSENRRQTVWSDKIEDFLGNGAKYKIGDFCSNVRQYKSNSQRCNFNLHLITFQESLQFRQK